MKAAVGTSQAEQHVDAIVGGSDSASGRLVSIGQLQSVLREVHARSSQPVELGSEALAAMPGGDKGDSRPGLGDRGPLAPTRQSGLGAVKARASGLPKVRRLLSARRMGRGREELTTAGGTWDIPRQHWAGSFCGQMRRWLMLAAAVMLLLVGAVTVVGRVVAMVDRAPLTTASVQRVSDLQFAGAAQAAALDYLSWDADASRTARSAALVRWGFAGAVTDGWDGFGRLRIENTVAIAVLRLPDDRAVVTVQARTAPPEPAPATTPTTTTSTLSGLAGSASWLTVAVPVAVRGPRVVITASPALVGSPPGQALGQAVVAAADEDTETGRVTAGTVQKLITAYGSGDLEFMRGPGSEFTGLAGMVTGAQVESWRMAKVSAGGDPAVRAGDVTVLWTLGGGAGQLRCGYRIVLVQQENRWLLQEITPSLEAS